MQNLNVTVKININIFKVRNYFMRLLIGVEIHLLHVIKRRGNEEHR